MILTARTGAGHDSVAAALAGALRAACPSVHVCTWSPAALAALAAPAARGITSGLLPPDLWYDRVAAHAPRLWGLFYVLTNRESTVRLSTRIAALLWGQQVRRVLRVEQPDLVVTVHPLWTRLADHVLRAEPSPPPHHCVVTDLVSVHQCWAAPNVGAFYVATPRAREALRRSGIPSGRVRVTGLPLRPAFARPPMPPPQGDAPHVLLMGGGHATAALERVVCVLLGAHPPPRLTIVCGRNERLRRRLLRAARGRATILGWCDDVASLMRACNVVVTKAGSVTLAETFSQARPALIYHALPGQEEGNAALLRDGGHGACQPNVHALPREIRRLCAPDPDARIDDRALWWGASAERVARLLLATVAQEPVASHGPPHRSTV